MTQQQKNSTIAAFDFDNTFIDRDSLLPFLFYMHGRWKASYHLFALTTDFLRYLCKNISRQEMKEKILTRFMKGCSFSKISELGNEYAENILDRFIKPKALKCLRWHQAQGHRCLIVSASLDFYLNPWAKRYGFEKVICSQLEINHSGTVTGKLLGSNCWGQEKKSRLLSYLGPKENYQLYAYGDSRGDEEMLEIADYPFYRKFTSN